MYECVLTTEAIHSQSHVLDGCTSRLPVDKVSERNPIKCYVILLYYYTDMCKCKKRDLKKPPSPINQAISTTGDITLRSSWFHMVTMF
jgi:hypothetical protein